MVYAIIQCNHKADNHLVKVLMLAEGQEVILSSGEFDFVKDDLESNPKAEYQFPRKLVISATGDLKATLRVNKVLEAQNMLENYQLISRFIAPDIAFKAGIFWLVSNSQLEVTREGKTAKERGTALHEIVFFKPLE